MTVLSFERYAAAPDCGPDLERELGELAELIRDAPGALWADVAKTLDEDPAYLLACEWRTAADLEAWDSTEAAAGFRGRAGLLLGSEPTRRRFDGLP